MIVKFLNSVHFSECKGNESQKYDKMSIWGNFFLGVSTDYHEKESKDFFKNLIKGNKAEKKGLKKKGTHKIDMGNCGLVSLFDGI